MTSPIAVRTLKAVVGGAGVLAPGLVGAAAYRLFSTPLKLGGLSPAQKRLEKRAAMRLQQSENLRVSHQTGEVQAYHFVATASPVGKTVILVHGWMSGARFMLALVDCITELGLDVVCFDLPAHGKSTGRRTDFIACARALQAVSTQFKPVHAIVAHSFGGAVTGTALAGIAGPSRLEVDRIVLIASPNELRDVARSFGGAIGLKTGVQAAFEARLATLGGRPLSELTGTALFGPAARPMLVLHSDDDEEVPIAQGAKYGALPNCTFKPLSGLGHRRVLYAPIVLQEVTDFLRT